MAIVTVTPSKDNWIQSPGTSTNNGADAALQIQQGIGINQRAIFGFDLRFLYGATINSAIFSMHVETPSANAFPWQLFVLTIGRRDWEELNSTYDNYTSLNLWTVAGASGVTTDRAAAAEITGTMPANQSGRYTFGDITALVASIVPTPDLGYEGTLPFIVENSANANLFRFHSRHAASSLKPRIVITYGGVGAALRGLRERPSFVKYRNRPAQER